MKVRVSRPDDDVTNFSASEGDTDSSICCIVLPTYLLDLQKIRVFYLNGVEDFPVFCTSLERVHAENPNLINVIVFDGTDEEIYLLASFLGLEIGDVDFEVIETKFECLHAENGVLFLTKELIPKIKFGDESVAELKAGDMNFA